MTTMSTTITTRTIPTITALADGGGALLDELDSLITELNDTLSEQITARIVIADAETEMSVLDASITLGTTGPNELARKAAITLTLHNDAGYQELARVARDARAMLFESERQLTVLKHRIGLVKSALALVVANVH
jgi:hypothetical protein